MTESNQEQPHASDPGEPVGGRARRSNGRRAGGTSGAGSLLAQGEPMVWLTGGTLALCLAMIIGLLLYVFASGFATFWPKKVELVELNDGQVFMGENTRDQWYVPAAGFADSLTPELKQQALDLMEHNHGEVYRRLYYTGNFDLTNFRNVWIESYKIAKESEPQWAMTIERLEWGRFYGTPKAFVVRTIRKVSQAEQDLVELATFIDSHKPDGLKPTKFTEEQWQAI